MPPTAAQRFKDSWKTGGVVILERLAGLPGHRIIEASLAGTILFAATTLPAAAHVEPFQVPAAVISLVLFAVSIPLALLALARAAVRTARQEDRITVSNLFFLQGSAPRPVRLLLLGSFALAVTVSVVAVAKEPFGILQPVFPLSLIAQWAARHGTFHKIADPEEGPRRRG
jgi:hypothetical protein